MVEWKIVCPSCGCEFFVKEENFSTYCPYCGRLVPPSWAREEEAEEKVEVKAEVEEVFPLLVALRRLLVGL